MILVKDLFQILKSLVIRDFCTIMCHGAVLQTHYTLIICLSQITVNVRNQTHIDDRSLSGKQRKQNIEKSSVFASVCVIHSCGPKGIVIFQMEGYRTLGNLLTRRLIYNNLCYSIPGKNYNQNDDE